MQIRTQNLHRICTTNIINTRQKPPETAQEKEIMQ
nr:MAG TPA: hypothetical protein [Caudoviricetes sp.]